MIVKIIKYTGIILSVFSDDEAERAYVEIANLASACFLLNGGAAVVADVVRDLSHMHSENTSFLILVPSSANQAIEWRGHAFETINFLTFNALVSRAAALLLTAGARPTCRLPF